MKKNILILMMSLLPLVASADLGRVNVNGVYYFQHMETGEIGVASSGGTYSGDIVIPESFTYDGVEYEVEFITAEAFYNCVELTSVTIGNNVKHIDREAFSGCTNLMSVTIGNGVTTIGSAAFSGCSSLIKLTIPNNVTSIDSRAFADCSGLISVTISESITSISNGLFNGCSGLSSVTIPESVTSIGNNAFAFCSGLITMTIPESVTEMGESIFSGCSSLTSVTIPTSVTYIKNNTFNHCTSLTSVTIPESITSIGDYAFSTCEGLVSLTIPESVTSIGQYAFASSWRLKSVSLPSKLKLIKASTFQYCDALESITIPAAVEYIYQNAFANCKSLKTVESLAETPPFLYENSFSNYDITLIVPEGCEDAYKAAEPWNKFMGISSGTDEVDEEAIVITSAKQTTYCSDCDLDFTGIETVKAYSATGYDRETGTIWLTRIYKVPAGEGILLIGDAGNYEIPRMTTSAYYMNMLVGTLEAKTINEIDGEYTNYYLSNGTYGVGFYRVDGTQSIGANRAYLPLLKNTVSSTRGFIGIDFDEDSDGTTGINSMFNSQSDDVYYNLQGQRVDMPGKGLYIRNGKKVVIK